MAIKYPAGVIPPKASAGIKKKTTKKEGTKRHILSAANRGMVLENELNDSCLYYREKEMAIIYKRPTPINIVKVDYSKGAIITNAFFEKQSTTDYNGVYNGKYIDFEAKSTQSKTSFPLSNIAPQQIEHLRNVKKHGGIAFFLINCYALGEVYMLDAEFVCDFYEEKPRKSIPFSLIKEKGYLVKEAYRPRFDYLPLIDEVFLK